MRYVGLLRGVNLGKRQLTMADLRSVAEEAGFEKVGTHLASGNVLFDAASGSAADHAATLTAAIGKHMGVSVPVTVRTKSQLEAVVEKLQKAFPDGDPTRLAVAFLDAAVPASKADQLGDHSPDVYRVTGSEILLHYPNGQARSSLIPPLIDKKLGVVSTVRGLKTVEGIIAKL
jgi:uncharacterized protein (DUF1697 family)